MSVDVVRVAGGASGAAPSAPPSFVAGSALAPVAVEAAATGLPRDADLVLDLSGSAVSCAAPHGVWAFELGIDDDAGLPFAREICERADVASIRLVRHGGGGDAVIRSGRFALGTWYPVALRIALREAGRWPATFVAVLAGGGTIAVEARAARVPRAPARVNRLRFYAEAGLRIAAGLSDALTRFDRWNVGFATGGPRRLLADEPLAVRWLPDPPALTFLADPFVVERDGLRVLFAEHFDFAHGRGVIDALVLDDQERVLRRVRALERDTHLSWPFPLEIDGELYLVPENYGANEVALYRCVRFPAEWQREAAIFPAFDGVDTTFFAHEGRWWAFCTRYSRGSNLALYAFHAPSPRGPWTEHALNPIVVDVASARPAGRPFVVDGVLYRLGQDCSQTYGGAVAVARVDALSPDSYRETIVKRLAPIAPFADGMHTVSFAGDTIVVDGKRTMRDARIIWRAAPAIFGRQFRRVLARLRVSRPTGPQSPGG